MKTARMPNPTPTALAELQTCFRRIEVPICANRLWERHLTRSDKKRLGCKNAKEAWCVFGTANMWARLRGITLDRAVCEVGRKLNFLTQSDLEWLMREIGESLDGREAMRTAIEMNELVLCEHPLEVYFRGELVDFDWERRRVLRTYFWTLVKHAKQQGPIDIRLFELGSGPLSNWKYELGKDPEFPIDLIDLIESLVPRRQRLNLPSEEIRIFEGVSGGSLREWLP